MSTATILLPNAIKTPGGVWTRRVVLEEMTGREEDILQDQTIAPGGKGKLLKTPGQRITEILSRCTATMGDEGVEESRPEGKNRKTDPNFFASSWRKAYNNDRGYSVIQLRQLSLGPVFEFSDTCPRCKKEIVNISTRLDELEVKVADFKTMATEEVMEVRTPSGLTVGWRPFTGMEEDKVDEIKEQHKTDLPSALLRIRLRSIDGNAVTADSVKDMTAGDRRFLQGHFEGVEGGIDTKLEITCDNIDCSHKFSKKMNVGHPNFFFPSVRPSESRETSDG